MAYNDKEWFRQMFGILEEISEMSDEECREYDQEFDRLSQQQRIKNISM